MSSSERVVRYGFLAVVVIAAWVLILACVLGRLPWLNPTQDLSPPDSASAPG